MYIEIESWKGDVFLYGKRISMRQLEAQIRAVKALYDRQQENFAAMLCRLYGWQEVAGIPNGERISFLYDMDTNKIIKYH